jgi:hypothetical protein
MYTVVSWSDPELLAGAFVLTLSTARRYLKGKRRGKALWKCLLKATSRVD